MEGRLDEGHHRVAVELRIGGHALGLQNADGFVDVVLVGHAGDAERISTIARVIGGPDRDRCRNLVVVGRDDGFDDLVVDELQIIVGDASPNEGRIDRCVRVVGPEHDVVHRDTRLDVDLSPGVVESVGTLLIGREHALRLVDRERERVAGVVRDHHRACGDAVIHDAVGLATCGAEPVAAEPQALVVGEARPGVQGARHRVGGDVLDGCAHLERVRRIGFREPRGKHRNRCDECGDECGDSAHVHSSWFRKISPRRPATPPSRGEKPADLGIAPQNRGTAKPALG